MADLGIRILHTPRNTAGVPWNLSRAQRKLGYDSDCITAPHVFDYQTDSELTPDILPVPWGVIRNSALSRCIRKERELLRRYDVFHFHTSSLFRRSLDIPILRLSGKIVIMHYHGTELRKKGVSPLSRISNGSIVSTPGLLEIATEALWIPNPVPDHGVRRSEDSDQTLTIGHTPSNIARKGTSRLIRAIHKLKEKHPDIRLEIVRQVPHRVALRRLAHFDLFVDQVSASSERRGWYGVASNEAQHAGIPVLTTIREDLVGYLPESTGIIRVGPEDLVDKLDLLIQDEELRKRVGEEGRRFVKDFHNPLLVAKRISSAFGF